MNDPISISQYGRERQQEIVRAAEAYWKAQHLREARGQNARGRTRLQRVAHLLTALYR